MEGVRSQPSLFVPGMAGKAQLEQELGSEEQAAAKTNMSGLIKLKQINHSHAGSQSQGLGSGLGAADTC